MEQGDAARYGFHGIDGAKWARSHAAVIAEKWCLRSAPLWPPFALPLPLCLDDSGIVPRWSAMVWSRLTQSSKVGKKASSGLPACRDKRRQATDVTQGTIGAVRRGPLSRPPPVPCRPDPRLQALYTQTSITVSLFRTAQGSNCLQSSASSLAVLKRPIGL